MGYKINIYSGSGWVNILAHDNLENLQGGNGVDEYYHLTADQFSWIDQDVTIGSSPSFYNTNMSGDISVWNNDVGYLIASDIELAVFHQTTPSTTWTITHNYGSKYVFSQAFLDDDTLIYPTSVELVDENNIVLTFDEAITGYVLYNKMVNSSPITPAAADHGSLSGLLSDDHTQYILVDGTRGFTGVVSGITPTENSHLTTKQYVDNHTWSASSILDFDTAVESNAKVSDAYDHIYSDGSDHTFIDQDVTIGSSPQFSNTNMYGPVSVWTNDVGYMTSDTIKSIDASPTSPTSTLANDLWVEFT